MISSDLSAAILAGGKSQRFGSSKLLARFDKKNLIEITLEIAAQISDKIMVLAGPEKINLPVNVVSHADIIPDTGPLGGIYTALKMAETDWVAVLPVDMPLLSPQIYSHLFTQRQNAVPIVSVSRKGVEPLVSIWPKSGAPMLEQFIRSNNLSLWQTLEKMDGVKLNIAKKFPGIPQECFFNINTRADLEQLERIK